MKDTGMFVKVKSKEKFINGIIELKKIGALGQKICYGTYLPDSYVVDDIINGRVDISEFDNVCGFSISYDTNEFRNTSFPHLFGKNHIQVSLSTPREVKMGDVSERKVKYKNMIEETINLINIKS